MSQLQVLCCSANIGNTKIDPVDLRKWVPEAGCLLNEGAGQYDIIAVGMQECIYKVDGDDVADAGLSSNDEHDVQEDGTVQRKKLDKTAGGWGTTFNDMLSSECSTHVLQVLGDCLGPDYTLVESVQVRHPRTTLPSPVHTGLIWFVLQGSKAKQ